jgi:hypothetical protein
MQFIDQKAIRSTHNFNRTEQKKMIGHYLTMKNSLGFRHFKPEIEDLQQEKENAKLKV